jgi:uncharacterized protein (DUF697 family)/tellurite resistance protein
MTTHQQEAVFTVCLMAALADGGNSDLERAELKRIGESFKDLNSAPIYQRVLSRKTTLTEAVAPLDGIESRQLACEMAVCVCDADDILSPAEKSFLDELRNALKLDHDSAAKADQKAAALATAPLAAVPPLIASAPSPAPTLPATAQQSELDDMILKFSIVNGALELLPDSLATMAIVPLQMKLVYQVGKRHGYELDRRHIAELLGVAGLGMTSLVVEGYARKLVGGLIGKVLGGIGRGLGNQLASSAMTFASTYALGQLARQYYGGGRQLSMLQMKQLFGSLNEQARSLHARYSGQIQDQASRINPAQLVDLVRGQLPGDPGRSV